MVIDRLHFQKSKKLMILLSIFMQLGFGLFIAGPKITNEDFIESSQYNFTLGPYENKTVNIPMSFDQIFYMFSAQNLVLKNVVLVEINCSSLFTLYKLDDNKTIKLDEHTLFYSSNLSDVGIMTKLIIENEANINISVKTNLKRVLTVKIADFTIPHTGFIIFIVTLLTLQFLSLAANGNTLIVNILTRRAIKLSRKNADTQKSHYLKLKAPHSFVLEIILPILLLCLSLYALIVYGQRLSYVKGITGYSVDYMAKIVLIVTVLGYFLAAVLDVFYLISRSVEVWILKSKGQEILELYDEASQFHKSEAKIIFLYIFIIFVSLTLMIVYGFEFKIIMETAICLCLILYTIVYYMKIKKCQTRLWSNGVKGILVNFMEIDAKIIGFWVLGIITIFAMFTIMMPLFSELTKKMTLVEFYPSLIYDTGRSFMSWVNDAFILFGQLQVPLCLILTIPYWITRTMICKIEAKYKLKLIADIAIFFTVFTVSEYFKWTFFFFTQNQPYNIASLPISILIGMTAGILKDLLTEIRPK